jgi:organic radical activating enzyme
MLKLNEIFFSIQGESTQAGRPCVFIRLTGCKLRCTYCDTQYAYFEGEDTTIDEPASEATDPAPSAKQDTPADVPSDIPAEEPAVTPTEPEEQTVIEVPQNDTQDNPAPESHPADTTGDIVSPVTEEPAAVLPAEEPAAPLP